MIGKTVVARSTIKPKRGQFLVEPLRTATRSNSGLYIPEVAQGHKPTQGIVIKVGAGKEYLNGVVVPIDVEVGDTVMFGEWQGSEVTLDNGDSILVMNEDDVFCIIKENNER